MASKSSSEPVHRGMQKVVVLGDTSVGKTSLLDRYVKKRFSKAYQATIGADFLTKDESIGDSLVALQIWDTAGQERFQSLGMAFYRGTDACVLVYDVTRYDTFKSLGGWMDDFVKQGLIKEKRGYPFVVLGNKSDVAADKVAVSEEEARAWCEAQGIPHYRVSAATGLNVDQGFITVVKAAASRVKEEGLGYIPKTVDMAKKPAKTESKGCC